MGIAAPNLVSALFQDHQSLPLFVQMVTWLLVCQVHILGKFKGGEKPNRAEVESILKAGGARLVDSAEAASADLVIAHPSLSRDNAEVCLCTCPEMCTFIEMVVLLSLRHCMSFASQCLSYTARVMMKRPYPLSSLIRAGRTSQVSLLCLRGVYVLRRTVLACMQVQPLVRAKVCCVSPAYIVEWLAKPKSDLSQFLLYKIKPGLALSKLAAERHLRLDAGQSVPSCGC